jgi:hypothetical protein
MVAYEETQETIMHTKSKKLITVGLAFGTLLTATIVQSASAAPLDAARESAVRECMALQNRDSHDPFGELRGGVQFHYRACMANHGQSE